MVDFYVTADGGSFTEVEPVAKAIEAEGFTVQTGEKGPNAEALRNNGTVKPPTKLVFICNGGQAGQTYGSFALDYSEGMAFTIFAFDNYRTHFEETSENGIKTLPLVSEWDSGSFATDEIAKDIEGHTTCSYQEKYPQVFAFVTDETSAESLGKKIAQGQYTCGSGSGGGSMVSSGGGAQIKDKTFEKCIRRICAATDSIFLVENNAAILFPYTDWMAFTLRQKINTIKSDEIDPNVFSMEYGNDGFYNKVSIAWGGGTLPDRFPSKEDSKKQVGKDNKVRTNYTVEDILNNMSLTNFVYDSSKATQKQEASTETTKKDKTTQKISVDSDGTTMLSEQYDSLVEKYGEMEKRVESAAPDLETAQYIVNALLIQYVRDFNSSCRCRALNIRKYIGGTFYAVENPSTKKSEMFYLNGYTIRTQKGEPLYHDLDFKYGPEGAEEILDYQTLSGGAAAGGSISVGGGSANEEQVWTTAAKISYAHANSTQDPEEAWKMFGGKEDSSSTDCYGMSAYLYYCFNNQANIPCQVVGDSGHHVVMIDRGSGFVETRQEYRNYNFDYLFKWREDQNTSVLLPAPSGATQSGGNTSNTNNNSGNGGSN